ncbi:WGR domain protein [Leptospira interrogans serovar Bataviae str. HAI135]|nr:WGR domain protein [Leptospira interrogans serovar Bataviae str. HAI135]
MKHQLTYQDGSSNKFWNIEAEGNSFTVTYGKIGTSGQTQTKTFDTEDKCQKEAQKLLSEKLKKGYQSSGEETVGTTTTSPKPTQTQSVSKAKTPSTNENDTASKTSSENGTTAQSSSQSENHAATTHSKNGINKIETKN